MFLNIGFIHYVKTDAITKFVPPFGIGVMTSANGIDIRLFHQENVLQHPFLAHHVTCDRVHFMTIHTTKSGWNPIDEENAIFDFQFSESYFRLDLFDSLSKRINEGEM